MNSNFVIMGLPASGKTTFLAALWHLVGADETECRLKLDGYRGDLQYLNLIAGAWRTFQPVPRTSQVGDMNVTIKLCNRETNQSSTVIFPDLAGETFDRQVEERRCRSEFVEGFINEDGILFFINADVKEDTLSVNELNSRMPDEDTSEVTGVEAKSTESAGVVTPAVLREWEPKLLPAQVKIVQLLSDLVRPPFAPRSRRLAILISAWDLTQDMCLTPRQWLAANMPFVDQFLRANDNFFKHQVYGVSAQGVNLKDDTAVDEIAKLTPSRRIQIVGPGGEGHDLTEPLVWLMSADK
ncbi:TRAFAC clade GTPase domain-containing protein [Xenorhabdus bovienii]|uniref:TRAFAC clade GTPase domain-containing protein n=1 Tax=Xenorhabdus bovienii TaxID=40576 RepID=UPI003DA24173